MNKSEQIIKNLAETYSKNPNEFINILQNSLGFIQNKKEGLFLGVGNTLFNFSYFKLAIAVWNKALGYFLKDKNKIGESKCYKGLGNAYSCLGDFRRAIDYHKKALKIAKAISNKEVEARCYANLGIAYRNLGDFRRAIDYHKKALKIAKAISNKEVEARCYGNLGNAHNSLVDFSRAIEYYKKALIIIKEIGDRPVESKCYTNLGIAYRGLGDFNKSIEYNKKALKIAKEVGDRSGESECYKGLGNAYISIGDFRRAIDYHKKALKIAKAISNKEVEARCYANLGIAYRGLGDFNRSIACNKKALKIAQEIGDIDADRISNYNLANIYSDNMNKLDLAYNYYRKSIELSEKVTGRLIKEEYKIGYSSKISNSYQYIVPLCIKLKKGNESLEFLERGKSRAFLDLLAATKIKPSIEVTLRLKSLLDDEEINLAKLRETQTSHLRQNNVILEIEEIDKTLEELKSVYEKIEKLDPEYVFIRRGKPLNFTEIQKVLNSQRKVIVLIEYFITKDKLFIFIVSSRDRKLHIEEVPISQERLNLYIENYMRTVTRSIGFEDIKDSWLGLNSCLIDPIAKYLTKGDLIYFIPYDLLHYLPLQTLELNGKLLIKQHPVSYLPSASLIRFCKNKGSGKLLTCASFGVVFEDEAKKVAELFKVKPYIGTTAAKGKVIKECANKDIIHFSCHGIFDYQDPLSSGVRLYDNKILTAREIFDLKLNVELVTLSACDTGINDRNPGDELVGLTRAFLYAGTPSVIVSLWSVDAKSTQELMIEFYRFLKNGEDKATSLQKAQVKIMDQKKYSHPYYWASFVLVGDWE